MCRYSKFAVSFFDLKLCRVCGDPKGVVIRGVDDFHHGEGVLGGKEMEVRLLTPQTGKYVKIEQRRGQ